MKQLTKDYFTKYTSSSDNSIPEKQTTQSNWEKDLNRHVSKEDIQMANKHRKRCLPSHTIIEMQIKTTMRYHLTLVRTALIKKSTNNKCWKEYGKQGTLNSEHCGWEHKLIQTLWKIVWRLLKKPGI